MVLCLFCRDGYEVVLVVGEVGVLNMLNCWIFFSLGEMKSALGS